jgi:hypothetical protein
VSSNESFKRLPKKRKFDLSDFETPESNKISVTSNNSDIINSPPSFSSSHSTSNFHDKLVVVESQDSRESNGAPPAIKDSISSHNGNVSVHQRNHDNLLSSSPQQQQQHQFQISGPALPADMRNIISPQHHGPPMHIQNTSSLHNSGNISHSTSHAAVIVTSSNRHSHSLSIPESQGLASKALINPQLDTHISLGHLNTNVTATILKSGGNYSPSVQQQQPSTPSTAAHEQKTVVYTNYGPTNSNRNVLHSPIYSNTGSHDVPPLSVYSINQHQYRSSQSEQPMDLGCRSTNQSQSQQSHSDSHYSTMTQMSQHQQTTIVNYRSRSPSPSYRIQQQHHKPNEPVQVQPPHRNLQSTLSSGQTASQSQTSHHQQQYPGYRGIVQPSKVR